LTTDNNALPGVQVEGFAFDLSGNLVYQTNYNGMVITNQYDELNWLTNPITAARTRCCRLPIHRGIDGTRLGSVDG
jgi:hypothetical protein